MPYMLVVNPGDHEEVMRLLNDMLLRARKGEVNGVALVCSFKNQHYVTAVAGTCRTNPTFSRGMVMSLADEIGDLGRRIDKNLDK